MCAPGWGRASTTPYSALSLGWVYKFSTPSGWSTEFLVHPPNPIYGSSSALVSMRSNICILWHIKVNMIFTVTFNICFPGLPVVPVVTLSCIGGIYGIREVFQSSDDANPFLM